MKLRKLQLENFRNYNNYLYEFSLEKNFTVLVGPNGKGKTNFLEAIYILSLGRSFRTIFPEDFIEWESKYMRCHCEVLADDEITYLDVFCENSPSERKRARTRKSFKKNDVNLRNSQYLGNLLTVLFHPEDLNMLYLSPSYRRKYMDILLSQTDKKYLEALSKYKKVLKQRNALLSEMRENRFKGRKNPHLEEDLDVWDAKILEYGPYIIQKRIGLVEFLSEKLEKIYRSISGNEETIRVKYKNTKNYRKQLSQKREKDIRTAKTSIGPHLDDLKFYINHRDISSSASRGEFRTLLLAIKLAEIEYIKQKTNKNPVLLLDDVFSELDRKRQKRLLKSIKNCQTIITTTNIGNLGELAKKSASIEFVKLE